MSLPAAEPALSDALAGFQPAVAAWFRRSLGEPTPAQAAAWTAIAGGRDTLVAAPTGSGKTLAAFLAALDALVREGQGAPLPDLVRVLYVSPLKALSSDIAFNLQRPLAGIAELMPEFGLPGSELRVALRTGDTPQAERQRMRRCPPHILVTTPESLYLLLSSTSGRAMLAGVESLIVDEIHALADGKRGAHLALSLERLEGITARRPQRIGLSATQRPLAEMARMLVGAARVDAQGRADCVLIDQQRRRDLDLDLLLPPLPLDTLMAAEVWALVHDQLAAAILAERSTLVFVNTRRMAERLAHALSGRLGEAQVAAHHGSLSRAHRQRAEQRLKDGSLRCVVATASLELGIDIGHVDQVFQIGSPRRINAFLQRVGRSGHQVGGRPRGRLVPTSRDELIECVALLAAVRQGELDSLHIRPGALDVLAQQVVAELASVEAMDEDTLYARVTRAWPYRDLSRADFDAVVTMLAQGFATERGTRGAWLHRDPVHRVLRARRGARLAAVTSGGTIPEQGEVDVILEPEGIPVGSVNEDFAIDTLSGDVFQLGNQSYRVLGSQAGRLRVADARGQRPSMPFWFGEAPGRSDALSQAVCRLRQDLDGLLRRSEAAARDWLVRKQCLSVEVATQIVEYLAQAQAALGALPTAERVILERFFDDAGGMQLVIHAPFGARVNRAWGLALRKRFCKQFNFELQAAADDDAIVLSLSGRHSFPLAEVAHYLSAASVRQILIQAVLDSPLFINRWRWAATNALAILRRRGGKKSPPQIQRMQAEDLIAQVFPDQIACQENLSGPREVPDHPLVRQSLNDALTEAMDIEALEALLARIASGEVAVLACDLNAPSPLADAILNARPYAFLDDAPAEERRTRAVSRPRLTSDTAGALAQPDPGAIEAVRAAAWPEVRDEHELQDALAQLGFVTADEGLASGWRADFASLCAQGRACALPGPLGPLWVAAERQAALRALIGAGAGDPETAVCELFRARLGGLGPVSAAALAAPLGLTAAAAAAALLRLEGEGSVLRGRFSAKALAGGAEEWCERRLLARIHQLSLGQRRGRFEPVPPAVYLDFLLDWQRLSPGCQGRGPEALAEVLAQLEGYEAPAAAWEAEILPARIADYCPAWLDQLTLTGHWRWARLTPPARGGVAQGPVRATPMALLARSRFALWRAQMRDPEAAVPGARAGRILAALETGGALYFDELLSASGLLKAELEDGLAGLIALGRVSADGFQGLRALVSPPARGPRRRRSRPASRGLEAAGRWVRLPAAVEAQALLDADPDQDPLETLAWTLLRRWGVLSRGLLLRESAAPSWHALRDVCRRLEDRGLIAGGRFVTGLGGEQFALPEAAQALRLRRDRPPTAIPRVLCAADPLNLAGLFDLGDRVAQHARNRILLYRGVLVAARVEGRLQRLAPCELDDRQLTQLLGCNAADARP